MLSIPNIQNPDLERSRSNVPAAATFIILMAGVTAAAGCKDKKNTLRYTESVFLFNRLLDPATTTAPPGRRLYRRKNLSIPGRARIVSAKDLFRINFGNIFPLLC